MSARTAIDRLTEAPEYIPGPSFNPKSKQHRLAKKEGRIMRDNLRIAVEFEYNDDYDDATAVDPWAEMLKILEPYPYFGGGWLDTQGGDMAVIDPDMAGYLTQFIAQHKQPDQEVVEIYALDDELARPEGWVLLRQAEIPVVLAKFAAMPGCTIDRKRTTALPPDQVARIVVAAKLDEDEDGFTFIPMDLDEMKKVQEANPIKGEDPEALYFINKDITGYHNLKTEIPQEYYRKKVGVGLETGETLVGEFYGFGKLSLHDRFHHMVLKSRRGWVQVTTRGGNNVLNFQGVVYPDIDAALANFRKPVNESPEYRVADFQGQARNDPVARAMADNMELIRVRGHWKDIEPYVQDLIYLVDRNGFAYDTNSPANTERAVLRVLMNLLKMGKWTDESEIVAVQVNRPEYPAGMHEQTECNVYFLLQPGQREILDRALIHGNRGGVSQAMEAIDRLYEMPEYYLKRDISGNSNIFNRARQQGRVMDDPMRLSIELDWDAFNPNEPGPMPQDAFEDILQPFKFMQPSHDRDEAHKDTQRRLAQFSRLKQPDEMLIEIYVTEAGAEPYIGAWVIVTTPELDELVNRMVQSPFVKIIPGESTCMDQKELARRVVGARLDQ